MQRPLSPVFGRTLPSELGAAGAQRGQKSRLRPSPAMGDPIDESMKTTNESTTPAEPIPPLDPQLKMDGPLKIAERISKHLDSIEKSMDSGLKKINNLHHHLYPIMNDHPDSKQAVYQMLSGFNKKVNNLTNQLRSLHFLEQGKALNEPQPSEQVSTSPIRPVRRLCASPVRKLQSWRV